jgi:hypothetical protein
VLGLTTYLHGIAFGRKYAISAYLVLNKRRQVRSKGEVLVSRLQNKQKRNKWLQKPPANPPLRHRSGITATSYRPRSAPTCAAIARRTTEAMCSWPPAAVQRPSHTNRPQLAPAPCPPRLRGAAELRRRWAFGSGRALRAPRLASRCRPGRNALPAPRRPKLSKPSCASAQSCISVSRAPSSGRSFWCS